MCFTFSLIFIQGEDVSKDNDNFWDEFFLLKPKVWINFNLVNLTSVSIFN